MRLIQYNESTYTDRTFADAASALAAFTPGMVNWLDLKQDDREAVEHICEGCSLHHLLIDDIVTHKHLPRMEEFDDYYFFSLKMLTLDENMKIEIEHLSIVLGEHFVITFQEDMVKDVFEPVRTRIFNNLGRIRKNGPDYLFYRMMDAVVSSYVGILEQFRDRIEDIEDEIIANPDRTVVEDVTSLKKQIGLIRKYTLPLREELGRLKNSPSKFVQKSTLTYLRDVFDNLSYITASFETFREMLKDLMDLHVTALNQSINNVMKTLTVISTIFIPLTFLVGIWGMNFDFMPETHWIFGYPMALGFMMLVSLLLLYYMKRKRWM